MTPNPLKPEKSIIDKIGGLTGEMGTTCSVLLALVGVVAFALGVLIQDKLLKRRIASMGAIPAAVAIINCLVDSLAFFKGAKTPLLPISLTAFLVPLMRALPCLMAMFSLIFVHILVKSSIDLDTDVGLE